MAALDLSVVTRRVRTDELMPYTHAYGGFLKKGRTVSLRLRESIRKLAAIIGLNTLDNKAVFFEKRRGAFQKIG